MWTTLFSIPETLESQAACPWPWTIQEIKNQVPVTAHQCSCARLLQYIRTNFWSQRPAPIKKQMFALNGGAVHFSLTLILTGTSLCSTLSQVRFQEVYITDRSAEWCIKGTPAWLLLRWHFMYSFPVTKKALLIWWLPAAQDKQANCTFNSNCLLFWGQGIRSELAQLKSVALRWMRRALQHTTNDPPKTHPCLPSSLCEDLGPGILVFT